MCCLAAGLEPVIERLAFFDANPVAVEYEKMPDDQVSKDVF